MAGTRTLTVGVVAAALVSFTAAAAAAAPAGEPVHDSMEFLDLSRPVEEPERALHAAPPSPGDVLRFDNLLRATDRLDAATRQPLGRFQSQCTIVEGTHAECEGTLVLRNGTIDVTGTPDLASSPIEMTVTGGSGGYAGVTGSARLTPTDVPGVSLLVVTVEHPAP